MIRFVRTVLPHSRGLKQAVLSAVVLLEAVCSNGITPFSGIETFTSGKLTNRYVIEFERYYPILGDIDLLPQTS